MRVSDFNAVVQEFLEREERLLGWKRSEYASEEGDALENFKTLQTMTGLTPAQVAAVYLAKHIQAILKQVNAGGFTWDWETDEGEGLKQRISDARNYLLLLAACIEEERAPLEGTAQVEREEHDPVSLDELAATLARMGRFQTDHGTSEVRGAMARAIDSYLKYGKRS